MGDERLRWWRRMVGECRDERNRLRKAEAVTHDRMGELERLREAYRMAVPEDAIDRWRADLRDNGYAVDDER